MNKKFIIFSVGKLLEILAFILIIPAAITLFEIKQKHLLVAILDYRLVGFIIAIISSFVTGNILKTFGSSELSDSGIKEGFAIVTFSWLSLTFFGAIPLMSYFLHQSANISIITFLSAFTDSYFEIMSGFTTTGATVISNVEILPSGILFWRSLTHWLGGMGIITLALAILPAFGIASYQMFKGEVPGPTAERLKPRLAQTAKILWSTYAMLTLLEVIFLRIGGMTTFDALCHSFGTMATGGFSTKNASIAAYNSPFIEWVIIVFMFLAGMNFIIHYRILFFRKFDILQNNREFHFYFFIILIAILASVTVLAVKGVNSKSQIAQSFRNQPLTEKAIDKKITNEDARIESFSDKLRHSAFAVVSITTTTGYCSADSDVWPNFIRYLLVILMFFGGCAGSTGGGIKMIRIMVIIKSAFREIKALIQPRIVLPLKIAKKTLAEKQVQNILGFTMLFLAFFTVCSLAMSLFIEDFTTSFTSVAATMCNIGPGLSGIGATENYAWIPLGGKWILVLCMLLGRLEIYTVLIAFAPISWKK
ncbi:MAG: TrkH family potassium uptake protein [Candidatus Omnitrophica bacterium]|nr:TrkH family potassium uptake protein [Candidatus Omnitrophota bacterium]